MSTLHHHRASRHRGLHALRLALVLCLVGFSSAATARASGPAQLLIVSSRGYTGPYLEVVEGLTAVVSATCPACGITRATLDEVSSPGALKARVQAIEGTVIVVTLGQSALRAASRDITDLPIVAGLVVGPDDLTTAGPNVTGVHMSFPLSAQLGLLKRVLPAATRLGVVYDQARGTELVRGLEAAARPLGLTILTQPVTAARDIPRALAALQSTASVLLGINDPLVFTQETAKEILLFSFRTKIPFVGTSPSWVEAGALYAPHWDHRDIGRQLAELVGGVLDGQTPQALPPRGPARLLFTLNGRTAEHMEIPLSRELRSDAAHVL